MYDSHATKRRYRLSGEKQQGSFRGFDVDTRAQWNGQRLRLEVSPQPGLVVVEHYFVDPHVNRLVLSIAVLQAGRRAGPAIRYIYDSVLGR